MKLKTLAWGLSIAVAVVLMFSGIVSFFTTSASVNPQSQTSCRMYEAYRRLITDLDETPQSFRPTISSEKLIFWKTHKTASSTLSGILWHELCDQRGQNCFLPPSSNPGRTWDLESPKDLAYIQSNAGTAGTGPPFDAWLHHAKMHDTIHTVMRPPTGVETVEFLSIVRDPAHRFRSAWRWYKLSEWFYPRGVELTLFDRTLSFAFGWEGLSLEQFVHLHPVDCHTQDTTKGVPSVSLQSLVHLAQSWYVQLIAQYMFKYRTGLDATAEELVGLRAQHRGFESRFGELLDKVLKGKVVLLVTDRFDESLLVLRRMLTHHAARNQSNTANATLPTLSTHSTLTSNVSASATLEAYMPLQQLLYLRQKKQDHSEPLSPAAAHKLHQIQPHDTTLYLAANTMLDRHIAALYGANKRLFHAELAWLKTQLTRLEQVCSHPSSAVLGQDCSSTTTNTKIDSTSTKIADLSDYDLAARCEALRLDNRDLVQLAWAKKFVQVGN